MGLRRSAYPGHGFAGFISGHGVDQYNWNLVEALDAVHGAVYAAGADVAALEKRWWQGRIRVAGRPFRWVDTSTVNDPGYQVAIKPAALADSDPGRFVCDQAATVLRLPWSAALADGAILWAVPTGVALLFNEPWWETLVNAAGGSSSTIGLSSSNKTGFTTKGDLLGGAGGDGASVLTTSASPSLGTIGAGFDTLAKRRKLWVAGETVRYDEVTSAFTSGSGFAAIAATIVKL